MSKSKKLFKKHFRVNHSKESSGHPSFIIRKVDDNYDSIGLTHSPITDNKKNIKLRKNPNPKDNRASYIRPFFRRDPIKKFSKRRSDILPPLKEVGASCAIIPTDQA